MNHAKGFRSICKKIAPTNQFLAKQLLNNNYVVKVTKDDINAAFDELKNFKKTKNPRKIHHAESIIDGLKKHNLYSQVWQAGAVLLLASSLAIAAQEEHRERGVGDVVYVPTPQIVVDAKDWFENVQTKDIKYKPFIAPTDLPPIWLNADIMAKYRDQMKKYYYDPKKYKTYLEQLGITYPTVKKILQ